MPSKPPRLNIPPTRGNFLYFLLLPRCAYFFFLPRCASCNCRSSAICLFAVGGLASGGKGLGGPAEELRGTHMLSTATVDFQHRAAQSAAVLAKGGTQTRGSLHSERSSSDLPTARNPAGGAWLPSSPGGAPSAAMWRVLRKKRHIVTPHGRHIWDPHMVVPHGWATWVAQVARRMAAREGRAPGVGTPKTLEHSNQKRAWEVSWSSLVRGPPRRPYTSSNRRRRAVLCTKNIEERLVWSSCVM